MNVQKDGAIMRYKKLILIGLGIVTFAGVASACPSCKDTIASTEAAGSPGVAGAFNSSVYLMLGGFLGVLAMVSSIIIKAIRGS